MTILNFTGRKLRPEERAAGAVDLAPLAQQDVRRLLADGGYPSDRARELATIAAQIQVARDEACRVLIDPGPLAEDIEHQLRLRGMRVWRPRGRPKGSGTGRTRVRVNLYLPQETIDRAEQIGEGVISAGVETSVNAYRVRTRK